MKESSILMSGPMVRATMRRVAPKTQTRRVVKPQPPARTTHYLTGIEREWDRYWPATRKDYTGDAVRCPYGAPGDRLWVREAWRVPASLDKMNAKGIATAAAAAGWDKPWAPIRYEVDGALRTREEWRMFESRIGEATPGRYRHARFMPRWACRLVLEVTAVRVERLQDISEADAYAEGSQEWAASVVRNGNKFPSIMAAYKALWDSLNAKRAPWASNPWVWVVEFTRCP